MGCGASKHCKPQDGIKIAQNDDAAERTAADAGAATEAATAGAAKRPASHVSQAAVSLAFLQRFVAEHRVRERRLNCEQLVAEVIKPATAATATGDVCRRYTDVVLRDPDPGVSGAVSCGRPFFFVSHAWGCAFADTVEMLSRHFSPEQQRVWRRPGSDQAKGGKGEAALTPLQPEEVFLWLDIFAVNQHQGMDGDASDLAALWEAVQDAVETLMVLDERGTPLTRIWCLYEAWQSRKAVEGGKLRLLSYGIAWGPLEKVFMELDVSAARSTVPADRDRILGGIRRGVGSLDAMTHFLKDALVAGTVAQVPPPDLPWDEDRVGAALTTAARLCKLYGRLSQSEALWRRLLEAYERELGREHAGTLAAVAGLAGVLVAQGRLGEAEALLVRDVEGSERLLGADHLGTRVATSNLANLLMAQGRYSDAEPIVRRQMEASERLLGPAHPDTLTSLNNLAMLLQHLGRDADSEPLLRRAWEGQAAALGPEHVATLTAANNLACALQAGGKLAEAEELHASVLAARERVLGPEHPDTLTSANNLGWVLQSMKRYEPAAECYRRALAGFEKVLGREHQTVFTCVNNLASVLGAGRRYMEAEDCYRRALEGQTRVLGGGHPDALLTACNLARLLAVRGDAEEAERLYRGALAGYEAALGVDHPDAGRAARGLAEVLEAQGRRAVGGRAG